MGARSDSEAPLLHAQAGIQIEGGEEMVLTGIDPSSGYQWSSSEGTITVPCHQTQLANDEVNDVLGDTHHDGGPIVGVWVGEHENCG